MKMKDKAILDACCGGREFWFNKKHPNAIYIDNRAADKGHIKLQFGHEVKPDIIMDFRDLQFQNKSFKLVVFDPPHMKHLQESSIIGKKYGCLNAETWQSDLRKGFNECWRVLDDYGVLIFKWSEVEIPLTKVLNCFKEKPLFGHRTVKNGSTIWCTFLKIPVVVPPPREAVNE